MFGALSVLSLLMFFMSNTPKSSVNAERVVCGFSTSSTKRSGEYGFEVADIPTSLCTHIVYDRMEIDLLAGELLSGIPVLDALDSGWEKLSELRRTKPELKLLASVYDPAMLEVAVEKNSRATLIKNMLQYMEWLQLDGIEVFLGGGSRESDEAAFTLLQELKSSFIAAGHPTWEVIVLVEIDRGTTDFARLCGLVDYVHVLSRPRRWPKYHDNSSIPVAKATFDIDDRTNITLQRALQYWIDNNCPANKIVLAVIFVARIFKLANVAKKWEQPPELTTMCSLSKGTGFCPYVELCQKFKEGEWTVGYDDTEGLAPHAFQSDRWVAYENEASAARKGEIAKRKKIAGVYVFALDMDDFRNMCGTLYPLTKALSSSFKSTTVKLDNQTN